MCVCVCVCAQVCVRACVCVIKNMQFVNRGLIITARDYSY